MFSYRANFDLLLIIISGIIGYFGLSSIPRFTTMVMTVPILWCLASSRRIAFATMFAYFLSVSRGLLPGAAVFLSENHTFIQAVAIYLIMPLGVALPFFVFWRREEKGKSIGLTLAFLTSFALPPISLIGIVNPLMAAGTVFRGFGYLGMGITLLLWALSAISKRIACVFLCVIVAFTILPNDNWYISPQPEGFIAACQATRGIDPLAT